MAVVGINTKCFILALFIRDDNERFLLGDGYYEFKNDLKHFQANTIVNDVVEVQGNDGYLLAGQVRRSGTQEFNGYIADGTVSKTTTEDHRRQFFSFFRKNHFYKVVYVMPDGSAIQRKRGFLVDDPTVSEMYQQYPEYHVALNFEDINYYVYDEDSEGHEIYGKSAVIGLIQGLSGGLIWDALGAVSDGFTWTNPVNVSGANITIDNQLTAMAPIEDLELKGDVSQTTYTGKNLLENKLTSTTINNVTATLNSDGSVKLTGTSNSSSNTWFIMHDNTFVLSAGTYTYSGGISNSVALWNDSFGAVTSSTTKTLTGSSSGNWSIRVAPNAATNVTVFPMVERGSSPTTYEPYVGEVPSPNPSYPQGIYTVSGEQTVTTTVNKNMQPLFANGSISSAQTMTAGHLTVTQFYSSYGQTLTVQDGEISTTSTNTSMWKMRFVGLEPSKQYTISATFDITLNGTDKRFFAFGNYRHTQPDHVTDRFSKTITTDATGKWESSSSTTDTLFYLYTNSSVVVSNIQLEKGSTATTYEAYMGSSHIVNLGKNLIDVTQASLPSKATGGITAGKIDIQSWTSGSLQLDIPFEAPAGTYTFSYHFNAPNGYDFYGNILNASGTNIGAIGPQTSTTSATDTDMTKTATITEASSLIRMVFYNPARAPLVLSNIQLERNETATPYTPYFTPIELAKIGTYQDYIYKSSGNWYVHKATNKVVFKGTETWAAFPSQNRVCFYTNVADGTDTLGVSDYYTYGTVSGEGYPALGGFMYNGNTNKNMLFRQNDDTTITTATDYKTWLQSHNVTVYYALATPTDTQITDATLISQLDALGAMRLYIGENNLSVSSASLPAILDFDYYSGIDYSGAGYEWEDGGTGGPETITVDSIDNVYPVWTVTGPALNPQLSVLTTNTTTTYAGTVAVGQTLVIDMFNKTATLNGTSVIGNVSGDWANFKPGNNRVIYSTNNADAPASKIEWQEVVG